MNPAVASQPESGVGPAKRLFSYESLSQFLQETNQPHELWDGALIMAPSPNLAHQRIVANFYRQLDRWVDARDLGIVVFAPIDMVLSPHRSMQPDIAFIDHAHGAILQDVIRGAADLVVEVISPGSRSRDRVEKKDLYEQHGIREYWIIDPEARSVDVLHLAPNRQYELATRAIMGERAESVLLPGFGVTVESILQI